ncbi:type IV toxin-antitoxin system AbiEi family antitoxin domain-containing protein [Nocardioides sp. InS609-2]|uniref:type IV toxin-antitoxin system AbiEi family antitoxin domain-containing protein n=1 Tax=Nocardioides sp. InS609-2 TaxID=2760705 RepID=UPI0020BE07A3|nr:type IV toxin-antitoxin system AbiEi family antitoxin domain-containing protein [Nocardioides sp. InS609-2]
MDPRLHALIELHGVFLRKEAVELGYHDHAIASYVRRGMWVRVRRGAYVFGVAWDRLSEADRYAVLCRAGLRQARTGAVLSHLSALNAYGAPLWDQPFDIVHLTRRDRRTGRKEAGIQQHRGVLLPQDVTERNGVPTVVPVRAALEIITLTNVEHAVVEIDWLLHNRHTTLDALRTRYQQMTHWPHTLRAELVLRLVDGRSESVGESRARYLCWTQGLPAPVPNYPILGPDGSEIARVDLAWPELGVFLEFDGKVKYQRYLADDEDVTECVLREKERESMICELTGWRCIRIVWADLYRPSDVAARIRRLFRPVAA